MAHNIEQARRVCVDRASEADRARHMSESAMRKALHRCSVALDDLAIYLTQIQVAQAANVGVDICGDLILADRLAAAQQRWNADDRAGALDALLEAAGHMRRHIDGEVAA